MDCRSYIFDWNHFPFQISSPPSLSRIEIKKKQLLIWDIDWIEKKKKSGNLCRHIIKFSMKILINFWLLIIRFQLSVVKVFVFVALSFLPNYMYGVAVSRFLRLFTLIFTDFVSHCSVIQNLLSLHSTEKPWKQWLQLNVVQC